MPLKRLGHQSARMARTRHMKELNYPTKGFQSVGSDSRRRSRDAPRRRGHQLWILSEGFLTKSVQNATRTENSLAGLLGQKRLHVSIFEAVTTLEHRLHFFPAN